MSQKTIYTIRFWQSADEKALPIYEIAIASWAPADALFDAAQQFRGQWSGQLHHVTITSSRHMGDRT